MTACIFSFGPSDRYESAQQASARTSLSVWYNRRANTGRAEDTFRENKMNKILNQAIMIYVKTSVNRIKNKLSITFIKQKIN